MMMITKEITKKLVAADLAFLESDDGRTSDEIVVKFFNPVGAATWWIVSGTPLNTEGEADYDTDHPADWHLFGFVTLGDPRDAELGYVLLSQLEEIKLPFGLGIERDIYYNGGSLEAVMAEVKEAA